MNSLYSVKARVFNLLLDTFFSSHFAFLEKIGNKENPDSAQDGGRSTLDGCLSTLLQSHKGGDGLQGGRVSRGGPVGSILADNLSDSDGYGDERFDHVADRCFNGSFPAFYRTQVRS